MSVPAFRIAAVLSLVLSAVGTAGARNTGDSLWRIHVSAQANIFAAGREQPPDPGDGSGGLLPPRVVFPAGPDNRFRIAAVGVTGCCAENAAWIPPDGASAVGGGATAVSGLGAIAGISGDSQMALVGVFLADGALDAPAPAALPPFTHRLAPADIAPALGQPFFIGDGRTGVGLGAAQRFRAPPEATALHLGFADAGGFRGPPGAYTDNPGGLVAEVRLTPAAAGVAAEAGDALRFFGQGGEGRTAYADALAFFGQSAGSRTAFAQPLTFTGQLPVALRAELPQALVFAGQGGGPMVAQAPMPLRFTAQGDGSRTAQSMPLGFVGQGSGTRSAHTGPLMFVGQGCGTEGAAPRENAGEIASLFVGGTDGWSIHGDAHGLSADTDGLTAIDDATGEVWFWSAPARFLGCRGGYYGGTLSFELRVDRTDAPFDDRDVVIAGADASIWYDTGRHPGTDWTPYRIALTAEAGWRLGDGGAPAGEAQIRDVLRDVRALRIRGEYRTGDDSGWLRAVALRPAGS